MSLIILLINHRIKYSDTIAVSGTGFKVFTREELKKIHYGALYILEKTGLKVESEDAAEIFHGGGAFVEKKGGVFKVKLPQYLVEECLSWVPRNVIYYGRTQKFDHVAEPDNGKTAAEVATKKAKEIIESHQPSPLSHGAEQNMNEMVAEFESKLRAEE